MPESNVTPLVPSRFFKFLSTSKLDSKTLTCVINAIVKYHDACAKAADTMEKEVNNCLKKHPVKPKPKAKAKPKARAKRK
jgi:hypothetical protein